VSAEQPPVLKGYLLAESDPDLSPRPWAKVQPTPSRSVTLKDEDASAWLAQFPNGSVVTITVESPTEAALEALKDRERPHSAGVEPFVLKHGSHLQ